MKKCFYLSSCIEIDSTARLTYAPIRSVFPNDERFRQTMLTVNNIRCLSPDSTIYVVDASENYKPYKEKIEFLFKNCIFVPVKEISTEADLRTIRTHPNKSLGESSILRNFLMAYESELSTYDYCFKLSGRYQLTENYNDAFFDESQTDYMFFKEPWKHEWDDKWRYHLVDIRKEEGDNCIRQYCTAFYGYGIKHLPFFKELYTGIAGLLTHPSMIYYDVEVLFYYLLKDYQSFIRSLPVTVIGWGTTNSGELLKF